MSTHATRLLIALATSSLLLGACERKPEDLEQWRNAKGGMDKMVEWAKSGEESQAVRERAVQILMEERQAIMLQQLFSDMKEGPEREQLAAVTVPIIESLWAANDLPVIDREAAKASGGAAKVEGGEKAIAAVEAAYYMHPFVPAADKPKLSKIMASWMSADQEVRNQLLDVTLGQMLPLAGPEGMDGMMAWFKSEKKPGQIARIIRDHADDKTKSAFAKVVAEVAMERHPEIDTELSTVILETDDEAIVPYLKRALKDPESPDIIVSDAFDGLARIQGARATPYFAQAVGDMRGMRRWVAATQLISLRGEAGIKQVPTALPLEVEKYDAEGDERLEKNSTYYCNLAKSELALNLAEKKDPEIKKKNLDARTKAIEENSAAAAKAFEPIVAGMLESPRWTSQALGLRCAQVHKLSSLAPKVSALTKSKQVLPGWGETTVGEFAEKVAGEL
jgi:hypothetical protein